MSKALVWRLSDLAIFSLVFISQSVGADSAILGLNRCAHELGHITVGKDHIGQIFSEEDIVFTTSQWLLKTSKKKDLHLLLVMNDSGLHAFAFPQKGSHRVQFRVPNVDPRLEAKTYYLKYHHSSTMPDRYTEFAVNRPVGDVSWSQYYPMKPVNLSKQSLKLTWMAQLREKVESISGAMALGQLERHHLMNGNLALCKNLFPPNWNITKKMNRVLESLELLGPKEVDGKIRRIPASL